MSKKNYHVVKASNHWAVKNNGLTLSAHNTQKKSY